MITTGRNGHLNCPACGAENIGGPAKFCSVCGKILAEDYQPLDTLRSSYGLQRTALTTSETMEIRSLFGNQGENPASQMAWACFVYSLVPYLGILFVPFTIIIGGIGYFSANRHPEIGGSRISYLSLGLSLPVFCIQIFFWWLLYIIPEISGLN